jgi:protein gp37
MNDTGILWAKLTWNPWSGCTAVSEGCKFCYAETVAENKRGTKAFPKGFDLTYRPHKLDEPRKIKEPSLIFCNSMSDLFWEQVMFADIDRVMDVVEATPRHEFIVLTKRIERALDYSRYRRLPRNVWLGPTIENERCGVERLRTLKEIDAAVKVISAEPLLGPLPLDFSGVDWVITGGESGTHLYDAKWRELRGLVNYAKGQWSARPERIPWVQDIRDRVKAAGGSFFHKQWGGAASHSAGRLLDGREWNEFPRLPGGSRKGLNPRLTGD